MPRLSQRGQRLVDTPTLAPYVAEHFSRMPTLWHPQERPDGYIPLCIAENKLDATRLVQQLGRYQPGPEVLGYDDMLGNWTFREHLASFLGKQIFGRIFPIENLAVLAGAGTVLEQLYYAIADPGEGVLVPTPSYSGFWPDLETRDGLQIVPVPLDAERGFELTVEALDRALETAQIPVKSLLFTNPNNPLACVYPESKVREIVDWTRARGLHLVADEVYALSTFDGRSFPSVARVCEDLGDDVHVVWAFSKDFGASGLRCGVLVSENPTVMQAVNSLAYWSAVSGHTQNLLSQFIADEPVVNAYLERTRASLRDAYTRVSRGLDALGVPYAPASAAFFVFCDFRGYLEDSSWEAERRLWRRILDEAGVNLTPGEACRVNEPGFFRVCYAGVEAEALDEAFRRLRTLLAGSA
jgi:1-aminocyclopropane-1-carboxylate synthase